MANPVKVFSLIDDEEQVALKKEIETAYEAATVAAATRRTAAEIEATGEGSLSGIKPGEAIKLTPPEQLLGIEPSVFRQIEAALNSGKQHILFYGPPGTGKTTLARWLANFLNGQNWTMITGSADWSSQDIIGGYQPLAAGEVKFFPGVLLQKFDRPLVIDELNRCDIDKVIGPLFTVLSGQATTLPYRVDAGRADSAQYTILPHFKEGASENEFCPGPAWRLIATINSIDKASLYQMSYALSRRFGWIFVDAPKDLKAFVQAYVEKVLKRETHVYETEPPLALIWKAINGVRTIGPAPIIDSIKALDSLAPGADVLGPATGDLRGAYLDVFDLFMLPLLDGILRHDAEDISASVISAIGFAADGTEAQALKRRLSSVAV